MNNSTAYTNHKTKMPLLKPFHPLAELIIGRLQSVVGPLLTVITEA
jgi:hypothetical protein